MTWRDETLRYYREHPTAYFEMLLRGDDGIIDADYEVRRTQDESPHLDATPRFPAEAVGSLLEEEE